MVKFSARSDSKNFSHKNRPPGIPSSHKTKIFVSSSSQGSEEGTSVGIGSVFEPNRTEPIGSVYRFLK
jgi:hypothetical protein